MAEAHGSATSSGAADTAAARARAPGSSTAGTTRSPEAAQLSDLLWLGAVLVLLIGSGLGIRAPWPADEPRFALIAREMVHTGEWLFPRIGGDLYPDKPPVYFWLLSVCYFLTGSLRASFLIPAFVAAATVMGLVYDLGRRLAGRASGMTAAITLTCCIQFLMTMRGAQIDPVLCGLTTLSLYGLLRHLLLGPAWGWYFVGGVAAGVGVVTKGVGFLPLLVLLPYGALRARGFNVWRGEGGWRWSLVVFGFLLGVSVWLVPMLVAVATRNDPALIAYRDEILFHQTVNRYASAWHHVQPWYYFILEVIPGLWLPFSLLLVWLVPRWAGAWRERDARVWLPLGWVLLTLLFFSLSKGKRGIYLFPALPSLALAAAPYLPELFSRKGVQRASVALGGLLIIGGVAMLIAAATGHPKLHTLLVEQGIESLAPIEIFVGVGLLGWALAWWKKPILAWPVVLATVAVVWSYGITPVIDGERSARTFTTKMLGLVPKSTELGLLRYKEQFLLYLDRPVTNFGHARWREGAQESYDASVWLNGAVGRVLLVPESALDPCFVSTSKQLAGVSSGDKWFLVRGQADPACVDKGDGSKAIVYAPPVLASG